MWFLPSLSIMRQQSLGNLGRLCLNENYVLTSIDLATWKEATTNITLFTSIFKKKKPVLCEIDYIPHNVPRYSHTQSEQRIRIMSWMEAPAHSRRMQKIEPPTGFLVHLNSVWGGFFLAILGRSVGWSKSSRVFPRPACYMLMILIPLSVRGYSTDSSAVKWWVILVMVLNELQPLPFLHSPTDSCRKTR